MKRSIKKAIVLFLAVIMVVSVGTVGAYAQDEQSYDSDSTYYKGAFYYRPGTGEYFPGTDHEDYYIYSDDYFKKSGRVYDPHLCTMSYTIAISSVSSTRENFDEEGYKRKNRNIIAILEDIGFSDIDINDDYKLKPTKNSLGICCARKKIVQDGKEYTLLAIVPRSAGYEAEWGDNFVLGAEGDAKGFDINADKCLDFAKNYITAQNISGDIKVWTVGYSRGATIANLTAAKLIDDPKGYLGDAVTLTSDDLYAYTCGTPQGADINNDPHNEKYSGIFTRYLNTEFASLMAPEEMGFTRYGVCDPDFDLLYKEENYDRMMENLGVINDYVHDTYEASINSKYFHPKKIGIVDGSVGMANDNNSYIPDNAAEYLQGLCAYLTEITGGRKEYAKTYEQPFSDLIAYYESLSDEESASLTSALTGHKDTINLVVALYAYFMNTKSESKKTYTEAQLREKTTELAAIAAGVDEEYTSTGIDASVIAKAAVNLGKYLLMDADMVKIIAADYLSNILKEAMIASGATEEELAALTNRKSCLALTHILSHLLLGNIWQSDVVRPLQLNNEQMKAAATLIGNAANLFVDHANEIIISWLKTEDTYYADFGSFEGSQKDGYRRVYVKADSSAVNGHIFDKNGKVIAEIEDGVVKNSQDRWIGFTSSGDGGFFRIPADSEYQIKLVTDKPDVVSVRIGEYSVYDAAAEMLFDKTVNAKATDVITVSLPALEGGEEGYELPSQGTEYDVTVTPDGDSVICGDIDGNGTVDAIDATWLQRYLADMIELTDKQIAVADANNDSDVTIMDVTMINRYLCGLKSYEGIGKPIVAES